MIAADIDVCVFLARAVAGSNSVSVKQVPMSSVLFCVLAIVAGFESVSAVKSANVETHTHT